MARKNRLGVGNPADGVAVRDLRFGRPRQPFENFAQPIRVSRYRVAAMEKVDLFLRVSSRCGCDRNLLRLSRAIAGGNVADRILPGRGSTIEAAERACSSRIVDHLVPVDRRKNPERVLHPGPDRGRHLFTKIEAKGKATVHARNLRIGSGQEALRLQPGFVQWQRERV